jgi:2-succinyl-6-hydroxy-2,4-cyclohexadiene-1-carboxylate synthase
MATTAVNGIEIFYREVGEGFPVVLVHGYTGNSRNWALTAPVLADRFRVISVDLRGHGLSEKPAREEDHTYPQMAEDVRQLLTQLGVDSSVIVGHSMGGRVVQELVLGHAELFRALVLVDTMGEFVPERRQEMRRLTDFARQNGMERTFDEHVRTSALTGRLDENEGFVRIWREQFLMTSLEAYIGCVTSALNQEPTLPRLASLSMPALVVCGATDAPFLGPTQRLHEALRGSEYVIIEECGHSPQLEKPAEFNELLLGFLTRVQEGAGVA